jgi:uncharacterized protein
MTTKYLDAVYQGKNHWWRYVLVLLGFLFSFLIIGSIVLAIVAVPFILSAMQANRGSSFEDQFKAFIENPSPIAYVLTNLPHLFGLVALLGLVPLVHRRSPLSLVSYPRDIRWGRMFWGFAVWVLLLVVAELIGFAQDPQSYLNSLQKVDWRVWLSFIPLALLFTPMQTTAEELFFRGYLTQALGLLTRQPLVLMSISGLLFAVPHFLNPEMARDSVWMGLSYFAIGVFWTLITLKDNRLELAIGAHAANNLYVVLVSTTADSALKTPALFLQKTPDPRNSFFAILVIFVLAYILYFIWPGKPVRELAAEPPETGPQTR